MKNTNVLEPGQIPQVAMEAMNGVHREELDIVNNVSAAIAAHDLEKTTQLCEQWLEHTRAHFDRENTLMEQYKFPAYHCHHGEHVEALDGLGSVLKDWRDTNDLDALAAYVREVWPKWYVNHISTMDAVTSAFIKAHI